MAPTTWAFGDSGDGKVCKQPSAIRAGNSECCAEEIHYATPIVYTAEDFRFAALNQTNYDASRAAALAEINSKGPDQGGGSILFSNDGPLATSIQRRIPEQFYTVIGRASVKFSAAPASWSGMAELELSTADVNFDGVPNTFGANAINDYDDSAGIELYKPSYVRNDDADAAATEIVAVDATDSTSMADFLTATEIARETVANIRADGETWTFSIPDSLIRSNFRVGLLTSIDRDASWPAYAAGPAVPPFWTFYHQYVSAMHLVLNSLGAKLTLS